MDTFQNFQKSSQLTSAEISRLDEKMETIIKPAKKLNLFDKLLKPLTALAFVSVAIVIVAISLLNSSETSNNLPNLITKVSAELIIKEAINSVSQLKEGKNLLTYRYVQTDNSTVLSDVYNVQDILYTLDFEDNRYSIVRNESRSFGQELVKIQEDGSEVTQYFPKHSYISTGINNTVYSYVETEGATKDPNFPTLLTKKEYPGEVFNYMLQDPLQSQEEMLKYVLNFIKPTSFTEEQIIVNNEPINTYRIDFDYNYKGFLDYYNIENVEYSASIYFDSSTYLPVKVIDTRLTGATEVFQTEYLTIDYSNLTKPERDSLFSIDLNDFKITEGDPINYEVIGETVVAGTVDSENIGEIFNLPILNAINNDQSTTKYWMNGNLFYDSQIGRPSILARFLIGKEVELKGLLLKDSSNLTLLISEYKITGGY